MAKCSLEVYKNCISELLHPTKIHTVLVQGPLKRHTLDKLLHGELNDLPYICPLDSTCVQRPFACAFTLQHSHRKMAPTLLTSIHKSQPTCTQWLCAHADCPHQLQCKVAQTRRSVSHLCNLSQCSLMSWCTYPMNESLVSQQSFHSPATSSSHLTMTLEDIPLLL